MARIRTIKPEFWSDEKLSLLDPLTRLVFLGLVSMADDAGRLVDNVKALDGMLFPNTDDTVLDALDILARLSRVLRYVAPSGQHLIQIVNWHHQKIDHPNKIVLPEPTADDYTQADAAQGVNKSLAQVSRGLRESRARVSRDCSDSISTSTSTMDHSPRLASRGLSTDEQAVLDHYRCRHPKRRPTDAFARKHIGPALKRYSPDELIRAIDGNADDSWHAERSKHELNYVLRADKIDGFIALAEKQQAPKELVGSADEGAVLRALGLAS